MVRCRPALATLTCWLIFGGSAVLSIGTGLAQSVPTPQRTPVSRVKSDRSTYAGRYTFPKNFKFKRTDSVRFEAYPALMRDQGTALTNQLNVYPMFSGKSVPLTEKQVDELRQGIQARDQRVMRLSKPRSIQVIIRSGPIGHQFAISQKEVTCLALSFKQVSDRLTISCSGETKRLKEIDLSAMCCPIPPPYTGTARRLIGGSLEKQTSTKRIPRP